MQEFRCRCCNRMLAKIEECRIVEIKCPKCKTINLFRDNEVVLVQVGSTYFKNVKRPSPPEAVTN